MGDWWDLIDHEAALKEQFPSVEQVRAERPHGPLARRADAAHRKRILERRAERARAVHVATENALLIARQRWQKARAARAVTAINQDSSVSGGSFVLEEGMK